MSNKENQSIHGFNGSKPEVSYAVHNVGRDGVLRGSDEATLGYVEGRYGSRAGHMADTNHVGVIINEPTKENRAQLSYLSELSGRDIFPATGNENGPERQLAIPYIRTKEIEDRLKNFTVWGLDPRLVDLMKNKAFSNPDVGFKHSDGLTGLEVPQLITPEIEQLVDHGLIFAGLMEQEYARAGVNSFYDVELVVRFSEADGGYGNAEIRKAGGLYAVLINGSDSDAKIVNSMREALEFSQTSLRKSMNEERENRVVVSRAIDVEDSPGVSILVIDGDFYSLGWNGQIMNGRGKACVGTEKYSPKNKIQERFQRQLEDKSAEEIVKYVCALANEHDIDKSTQTGIFNADLLLPGEKERAYLEAKGKNPFDTVYFVEFNPRWTNRTDAISFAAHVLKSPHSVSGYRSVAGLGVKTLDSFPHRGLPTDEQREASILVNKRLGGDAHTVIRMAGEKSSGVIFIGDTDLAQKELKKEIG